LSFFDDDEETAQRPAGRAPRAPQRPSPRRPQRAAGSLPLDQHTLMVRRRVAAGVGVVLLIVIILLINGCLKGQKTDALKTYNHEVSQLAQEFDEHVSRPLFAALTGAGGKSALNVEVQVDQLRVQAQDLAARVKKLSTPGELADAQRDLLLAFDLRTEAVAKVAALTPTALGGQGKQAIAQIAGDLEIFLASDVLYSQRVAPLIQQELKEAGVEGLTTAPSRSLPNIGWLEPTTAESRITGKSAAQTNENTSGTHGSALTGVSVGANTLAAEPTLNHVSGGSNPTFTVNVENGGESAETNVKVNVTVTAGGKQFKASHSIEKAEPGKTVSVDIPVNGVPLGQAAKVEVEVEKVPGETNTENNKGTFLAVFAK
jgi:outer membrane murein-binding lipoprotein Lpp